MRVRNREEKDATLSSSVSLKLKLPMFAASSEGPFGKNSLDSSPARFRLRLGGVIYAAPICSIVEYRLIWLRTRFCRAVELDPEADADVSEDINAGESFNFFNGSPLYAYPILRRACMIRLRSSLSSTPAALSLTSLSCPSFEGVLYSL